MMETNDVSRSLLSYLVYGIIDVAVEFTLGVDGLWSVVLVILQEKVFE